MNTSVDLSFVAYTINHNKQPMGCEAQLACKCLLTPFYRSAIWTSKVGQGVLVFDVRSGFTSGFVHANFHDVLSMFVHGDGSCVDWPGFSCAQNIISFDFAQLSFRFFSDAQASMYYFKKAVKAHVVKGRHVAYRLHMPIKLKTINYKYL